MGGSGLILNTNGVDRGDGGLPAVVADKKLPSDLTHMVNMHHRTHGHKIDLEHKQSRICAADITDFLEDWSSKGLFLVLEGEADSGNIAMKQLCASLCHSIDEVSSLRRRSATWRQIIHGWTAC